MRYLVLVAALLGCAHSYGRVESNVVFTQYSPLSRNAEIARRALPPLTHRRIAETLAARKERLAEQAIDLAQEKFDIYVPAGPPPPGGYGLLVFIAPWPDATRPHYWQPALDKHQMIFVAAQNSGNDAKVLDRRMPLALLAYQNVHARYPIDDRRVYVGGLSGGSRVAEMLALAYPDIFHGAVLNAGADPIDGREGMYKPPAELFRAFQHSRLVFITGDEDYNVQQQDDVSLGSLKEACVLDVKVEVARGGHKALDDIELETALDALEAPRRVDPAELARCNARVEQTLAAKLAEAEATIGRGDRERARQQLKAIEAVYGGLAADRLLDLDSRLVR